MFQHTDRPTIPSVVRQVLLLELAAALTFCSLGTRQAAAQQAVVRDPQGLTLIGSSLKALTGSVSVNDATVQATAAYVAGSDEESGTATLTGHVDQQSLVQLNLSGGARHEIRNGAAGVWVGPDGAPHAMATHNCWSDASWFFPALTLEAISTNPQVSVSYLGPDTSKGATLLHVRVSLLLSGQSASAASLILSLSTMDIYFDPQSFLPLVLDFNIHPDNDANVNLAAEIRFGAYQSSNGVSAPTRIQKCLQNSLLLDLTVTNVAVNSGVPASDFTLPVVPGGG